MLKALLTLIGLGLNWSLGWPQAAAEMGMHRGVMRARALVYTEVRGVSQECDLKGMYALFAGVEYGCRGQAHACGCSGLCGETRSD